MKTIALDVETRNLIPYKGIIWSLTVQYTGERRPTVYANADGLTRKDLPKRLIADLEDSAIPKIAHNIVFDGSFLASVLGVWIRNLICTQNQETIIQGVSLPKTKKKSRTANEEKIFAAHGVALDAVLPRYKLETLDKEIRLAFIDRPTGIPFTRKEIVYMEDDVRPLIRLAASQDYLLHRDKLNAVADLENEYVRKRILAKVRGIGFDRKIWAEVADQNGREFERRMAKLPGDVQNWNSERQVKAYFRRIGINIDTYKSKKPDVDDLDSQYLKTRNKTLGDFILARELHKAVTSYGINWFSEGYVDDDDRIRPDVNQIIETGRTSMSNPNLQQLPGYGRKDYEHDLVMNLLYQSNPRIEPQHRRAFVPAKGCVFIIGDFSGQEIGIMAAAANEKLWIDTMLRGDDVHGMTASILYKDEWDRGTAKGCTFPKKCSCPGHVTPRERAKILNFMLAYGGGPTRFSKATGLPMLESKITVQRYRRIIPSLTKYLERNGRNALNTGESYSADPYRRRRVLRGEEEWHVINQGKNNPIQAAGANMLKLAVVSVPDRFYCPLEIHDEIILEVKKGDARIALKTLESVMNKSADYITGIKGLIRSEPRIAMNLMKKAGQKNYDLYGNKLKK